MLRTITTAVSGVILVVSISARCANAHCTRLYSFKCNTTAVHIPDHHLVYISSHLSGSSRSAAAAEHSGACHDARSPFYSLNPDKWLRVLRLRRCKSALILKRSSSAAFLSLYLPLPAYLMHGRRRRLQQRKHESRITVTGIMMRMSDARPPGKRIQAISTCIMTIFAVRKKEIFLFLDIDPLLCYCNIPATVSNVPHQ